jgi:hypothetical protein
MFQLLWSFCITTSLSSESRSTTQTHESCMDETVLSQKQLLPPPIEKTHFWHGHNLWWSRFPLWVINSIVQIVTTMCVQIRSYQSMPKHCWVYRKPSILRVLYKWDPLNCPMPQFLHCWTYRIRIHLNMIQLVNNTLCSPSKLLLVPYRTLHYPKEYRLNHTLSI